MAIKHTNNEGRVLACSAKQKCQFENNEHHLTVESSKDLTPEQRNKIVNIKNAISLIHGNKSKAAHYIEENYSFNENGDFVNTTLTEVEKIEEFVNSNGDTIPEHYRLNGKPLGLMRSQELWAIEQANNAVNINPPAPTETDIKNYIHQVKEIEAERKKINTSIEKIKQSKLEIQQAAKRLPSHQELTQKLQESYALLETEEQKLIRQKTTQTQTLQELKQNNPQIVGIIKERTAAEAKKAKTRRITQRARQRASQINYSSCGGNPSSRPSC